MTKSKKIARILPVGAVVCLLAACTTTTSADNPQREGGADGSRVRIYSSAAEMASDSVAVVVGTVADTDTVDDIDATTDFTVSNFNVNKVLKGDLAEGSSITVRQLGSEEQMAPATLLEPGTTYLLYLTASGLGGNLASQYYVTGGNAGLYSAASTAAKARSADASTSQQFTQLDPEEGEDLPQSITPTSALG